MTDIEQLRKTLLCDTRGGYDRMDASETGTMEAYCREYIRFISEAKTEREAVKWTVAAAEAAGYRPFTPGMELQPGDKVYHNNRGKSVFFVRNPWLRASASAQPISTPRAWI